MSKIDPTLVADTDIALTHPAHGAPAHAHAHDTSAKSEKNRDLLILLITLTGIALWGLSVATFGIPGLYIPALIAVPVIWVLLILITRG